MQKNASLLAIVAVHAAENEPSKVGDVELASQLLHLGARLPLDGALERAHHREREVLAMLKQGTDSAMELFD